MNEISFFSSPTHISDTNILQLLAAFVCLGIALAAAWKIMVSDREQHQS